MIRAVASLAALVALAVGGGALAQAFDPSGIAPKYRAPLDACYGAASYSGDLASCRGIVSQSCQNREPDGSTTRGIVACISAETAIWDGYLNSEYQTTMADMRGRDAAEPPEFAKAAGALRDAQRAWIAYRDAECLSVYSADGSGSIRYISVSICLLDMTSERTIALRARREQAF